MFMEVQGWDWSEGSCVRAEAVNYGLAPKERASRLPHQPAYLGQKGKKDGWVGKTSAIQHQEWRQMLYYSPSLMKCVIFHVIEFELV